MVNTRYQQPSKVEYKIQDEWDQEVDLAPDTKHATTVSGVLWRTDNTLLIILEVK